MTPDSLIISSLQEVQPNSPASAAGLRSDSDYIIGADTVLNEVCIVSHVLKLKLLSAYEYCVLPF
mgnify:CR=1 FL=1